MAEIVTNTSAAQLRHAVMGFRSQSLTKTVPQFMQKSFNASTAAGSIAVAGLSEGGLCATTLALNNPKEYVAFGNYSGDASPTYQYDSEQQTIQTLFGGSQAVSGWAFSSQTRPWVAQRVWPRPWCECDPLVPSASTRLPRLPTART